MATPVKGKSLDTKRIKKNNPAPKVLESEQNACLPQQTVLLHVIDVGHGLAVLVELRDKTKHGNDVVELNLVVLVARV